MTLSTSATMIPTSVQSAPNFRAWQRDTFDRGLLPVIGIAGGRGKSTVVRMLDAILNRAHLRTATWTNLGVEIRGRRQRGEISGWSTALARISESSVDVAIQELHWSTVNAVGLPSASYPLFAITNIMGSLEAPLDDAHTVAARRGSMRVAAATHGDGVLVVTADDPVLMDAAHSANATVIMTSLSNESPNLRRHLEAGGAGVWVESAIVLSGDTDASRSLMMENDIASGLNGSVQFEVSNALTAIGLASIIGVDSETIAKAVREFETSPEILPGSFNVLAVDQFRVIVDSAVPSWHLRGLLRCANPRNRFRQISVLGDLSDLPESDLPEVGRLLGRHQGAIILHSNSDYKLVDALRRGISANDFPPIVIHLPTERRALNRALKTARPDDLVLILTNSDPGAALRAVQRQTNPGD